MIKVGWGGFRKLLVTVTGPAGSDDDGDCRCFRGTGLGVPDLGFSNFIGIIKNCKHSAKHVLAICSPSSSRYFMSNFFILQIAFHCFY